MNYYKKNIEAIEKCNKEFARVLKNNLGFVSEYFEKVDQNNFLVKSGAKQMLAYEKNNEKEKPDEVAKGLDLYKDEATIFFGVGNGYFLKSLLDKSEDGHVIFLVEPIIQILNYALENFDFKDHIIKGKLIICTSKKELPTILYSIEGIKIIQQWHTLMENYTGFLSGQYADIIKVGLDTLNQIMCNTGTVMGAGAIIAENDIQNLPYVISSRGVEEIRGLFKGKPAIVILSAPTVTKLIPQLLDEKIRKKIVIIAIAQMLRPLLAFGIKPDFITTVDYGEVNYEHFDNLWHITDVPLVALNRSYAEILKCWKGNKFIVTGLNPGDPRTVIDMLNKKGQLEQGGSVGHMALGLAIHLGCNPIIHIGFDCAYESGLSHNPLGDAVGKINFREDGTLDWDVDDPNSTLKNKNHKMGQVVYVPGYFGKPVPTNIGLASFITAMENIFEKYKDITFINSCEGGARKKFCTQMSLKKALATYCKKDIDKDKIKPFLSEIPNSKEEIEEAKKRLKFEIGLFDKEIEACDKAIKATLRMMTVSKGDLKKLLAENEKYAKEAQEIAKQSNLLSLHIYKTSREIASRKLKVIGETKHLLKNKDDLGTRVKRSKMILEAAKESAIKLKEIYSDVLIKLEQAIIFLGTYDWANANKIKPETWEKLIENRNWARPLLEAEYIFDNLSEEDWPISESFLDGIWIEVQRMKKECIQEGLNSEDLTDEIDYYELIEKSREAGLNKDFNSALSILKKAEKIFPEKIEALWGLATTLHHLGKITESIKYYSRIIKLFPDNLRFQYELGQVYLQRNTDQGIQRILDVMGKTKEFDSFYLRLAEIELGRNKKERAKEFIDKYLSIFPYSQEGIEIKNIL